MTMTLIETVTVGVGGASTISFTSIPQDATDLLLLTSFRLDATTSRINVRLNSDSGSNYTNRTLFGNGSTVTSFTDAPVGSIPVAVGQSGYTANTFSNGATYITNYTSAIAKSISTDVVVENNATASGQYLMASNWSGTAAITNLLIVSTSNLLVQYSTASLYKITKGSDGSTVVS